MISSKGLAWLSLHLRRATGGAAGRDSFEVTGGKTCYQAAAGAQVRDNLSLIPDQSWPLYVNKILAFSHRSTYQSPNRITRPIHIRIDPNSTDEKFHTSQDHRCLCSKLICKGCNKAVSLPARWSWPWPNERLWQLLSGSMCLQVSVIQRWSQSRWHALVITVRRQFGDKIQYCHFQYVLKVIYRSSWRTT